MHVGNRDLVHRVLDAFGIGGAQREAAADAAASNGEAIPVGPVITAAGGIDLRRTPKLSGSDHDRLLQ